ncbi:MAG: PepSY domain-containing protein [Rubripirellula sp.]
MSRSTSGSVTPNEFRETSELSGTQTESMDADLPPNSSVRRRSISARVKILIRRAHLFAGLFLLPWVFLYGVTGGMFNHQGLFPEIESQHVPADALTDSSLGEFPAPDVLAQHVVDALEAASAETRITLAKDHRAEFTNPIQFEIRASGDRYVIQIDPITKDADVVKHPAKQETLEPLLRDIHNLNLAPDPQQIAQSSVTDILAVQGIESNGNPRPFGWTKLNFLALVDDQPARITYVLKDGHVDVTRHTGEDGMSLRQFMLRLHTSHGQSPHWNGRSYWSLFVDAMAIAMVCWGLTGLFMWWQLKRMRLAGGIVLLASLATATYLYLSMIDFYASTKL